MVSTFSGFVGINYAKITNQLQRCLCVSRNHPAAQTLEGDDMQIPDKKFRTFRAEQLAQILCMARNTVYQQRRRGTLPNGVKHGSVRLWTRIELANHSPQLAKIFGDGGANE